MASAQALASAFRMRWGWRGGGRHRGRALTAGPGGGGELGKEPRRSGRPRCVSLRYRTPLWDEPVQRTEPAKWRFSPNKEARLCSDSHQPLVQQELRRLHSSPPEDKLDIRDDTGLPAHPSIRGHPLRLPSTLLRRTGLYQRPGRSGSEQSGVTEVRPQSLQETSASVGGCEGTGRVWITSDLRMMTKKPTNAAADGNKKPGEAEFCCSANMRQHEEAG